MNKRDSHLHTVTTRNLFWRKGWQETQALRQSRMEGTTQLSCSSNRNFKFLTNFFAINLEVQFYLSLKNIYLILKATYLLSVLHFGNQLIGNRSGSPRGTESKTNLWSLNIPLAPFTPCHSFPLGFIFRALPHFCKPVTCLVLPSHLGRPKLFHSTTEFLSEVSI